MKSTIRIELDFETMQPVLRIQHDAQSDDLRDQTLKYFIEKASHGGVLYLTFPELQSQFGSTVEIRCEWLEEDPLKLIDRCRNVATTLCKTDEERDNIAAFFGGLDAKASIEWLNRAPTAYKAKYSM